MAREKPRIFKGMGGEWLVEIDRNRQVGRGGLSNWTKKGFFWKFVVNYGVFLS